MKSVYRFALMLCIGGAMIALAGCNKMVEYLEDNPTAEYTACKIKKVSWNSVYSPMTFQYNNHGDLAGITPAEVGTGYPNRIFRYDASHRLKEYIMPYSSENGGFELWIRYVYNNQGRVIRDTTWSFGTYGENPANEYNKGVTTYSYDAQGRISHTHYQSITFPQAVTDIDYVYDIRGNLVVYGATYDDKINYRRTDKVLMFIERDYSVNNIKPVGTYNQYHLPVKSIATALTHQFLDLQTDQLNIEYKCN
ncbi:MAG: hypothetical protein J7621_11355 [Niastella sp.]|nr:hypothetical protein [Niastella sp.]